MANDPLRDAARALMEAVENDENQHGGTISRSTLLLASMLRIEISTADKRDRAVRKEIDAALQEAGL